MKSRLYDRDRLKTKSISMKPFPEIPGIGGAISKTQLYFLSAFLPFICMLVIYKLAGVYPFGDNTVLVMDSYTQYSEFAAFYQRVLSGGDSIFYSFTKELGGSPFGIFSYYLSSPFFLLMLLFPRAATPEAFAFIELLKISACGLTFSIFLHHRFNKSSIGTVIFSCAYALMTYSIQYSMCTMWIDGVIWLPIIILGVERILDGKSPILMLVSYALAVMSNYYTAYMTAVFAAIYFVYRYFVRDGEKSKKDFLTKFAWFAGTGVVAAMLSSWILIPSLINATQGKLASGTYVAEGFLNIDIEKIPRRLFIGQYDSITNNGNPNIFCGVLCMAMACVYFCSNRIKRKDKIAAACVYVLFIISFFVKEIDMAWHIFKYPNWFPYRYAYTFNFFNIMIAFMGFIQLSKADIKRVAIGGGIYAAAILLIYTLKKDILTNTELATMTIVITGVYALLIFYMRSNSAKRKRYMYFALLILTCTELTVNGYATWKGLGTQFPYKSKSEYTKSVEDISGAISFINSHDNGLFRTEKNFYRTENDGMSFGYNGVSHYSSTYNKNTNTFVRKMGLIQSYVAMRYFGSTITTDGLLGVKYIISANVPNSEYKMIHEAGEHDVYENPYALPIAFSAPKSALSSQLVEGRYMDNQNALTSAVFGREFAKKINITRNSDSSISFTADTAGEYYIEMRNQYSGALRLFVNNREIPNNYEEPEKKIFCIAQLKPGDTVKVIPQNVEKAKDCEVYAIDTSLLKKTFEDKKNNGGIRLTSFSPTEIEGEIDIKDNELIFTTIPYEEGWSVYVDGKRVEPECAQEAFIAIDADAGTHSIQLKYSVPGFGVSMTISLLTLVGILAYVNKDKIKNKLKK